jgi:hypothetical protein
MEDESGRIRGEVALHMALDRLAQVIQVALVTHSVYGNIRKYFWAFVITFKVCFTL